MAASIALNSPAASQGLTGLWWSRVQKVRENLNSISRQDIVDRVNQTANSIRNISREDITGLVKKTGDHLRNMTKEDVGFLMLNAGVGFSAKALAVGLFGTASGGTTILAAAAGGAMVGVAKDFVTHTRSGQSARSFFKTETLLKASLKGAGSSLAFMGVDDIFHAATGHTVGESLSKVFHKATNAFSAKSLFDNIPLGAPQAQEISLPKPVQIIPAASAPVSMPSTDAVNAPLPKPVAIVPPAQSAVDVAAAKVAAPTPATLNTGVYEGPHKTIANDVRERAFAKIRALNPFSKAALDAAPVATVPSAPVVTADVQPVGVTVEQRAMDWAKKMNPTPQPPISADKIVNVADLPKTDLNGVASEHIVVRTPAGIEIRMPAAPDLQAELRTANVAIHTQNAYNATSGLPAETDLDPEKMAGGCITDIPATQGDFQAQSQTLPTNCAVAPGKLNMDAGDFVTVRDGNGGRVRAIFSKIAERTSSFMTKVVPLEVTDMAKEKMAVVAPAP